MNLQRILGIIGLGKGNSCHNCEGCVTGNGLRKVGIVGNPNVGKSLLFNRLTGMYATVSNYPGTTVTVTRGKTTLGGREIEVVDTPGMYSLLPITEEERVARSILLNEKPDVILNVVDSKNLERMLPLTLQLIEAGFPVVLDLNMIDELESAGMSVNLERLQEELGIPVISTSAANGHGIEELKRKLLEACYKRKQN